MFIKKIAITVLTIAVLTTVTACSTAEDEDIDQGTDEGRDEITEDRGETTIDDEDDNQSQIDVQLTIEVKDILGTAYEEKLEQGLRDKEGIILSETTVSVDQGTTVDELLDQTLKENKIDMVTEGEGVEKILRDIQGIGNGIMGEFSGWIYTVNGENVDKGIYEYELKDGDKVKVYYTENTTIGAEGVDTNDTPADSNLDMAS